MLHFPKTKSKLERMVLISTILEFNPLFQAIKMLRMGKVEEVSLLTFLSIMTIGGLWLWYGIEERNKPLIVGNAIKLVTSFIVVAIYWLH